MSRYIVVSTFFIINTVITYKIKYQSKPTPFLILFNIQTTKFMMTKHDKAAKPNFKVKAYELMALKNAIEYSKRPLRKTANHSVKCIDESFSSLICVNISVRQSGSVKKPYTDIVKYFLVASNVPYTAGSMKVFPENDRIFTYYQLNKLQDLLKNAFEEDSNKNLEKNLKELKKQYEKNTNALRKHENTLKNKHVNMLKAANKNRGYFVRLCVEGCLKNQAEASKRKMDFIETILNLSANSKKEYDMEKWLDGYIHIELEPLKDKKKSEKFLIKKIVLKAFNNIKPCAYEYCFETTKDTKELFFKPFSKGNFYKYVIKNRESVKSSLCLDALEEFLTGMNEIFKNSSWFTTLHKDSQYSDACVKKKTTGLMFFEIWIIREILNHVFTDKNLGRIEFFTNTTKEPSSLRVYLGQQKKGKPLVSTFLWPKTADFPYNFQCFILDPSLDDDVSSFINGLYQNMHY